MVEETIQQVKEELETLKNRIIDLEIDNKKLNKKLEEFRKNLPKIVKM